MRKGVRWTCAALVLAAGLLAGGCGGEPTREVQPAVANRNRDLVLRSAMVASLAALDRFESTVAAGDNMGAQAAFQEYQQTFGEVLAPTSFQNPDLARQMANANTRLEDLVERSPLPAGPAAAAEAAAVRAAMTQAAEARGISLLATASGQIGAGSRLPGLVQGRTASFTVTVRENALVPARIEVENGTRVTIRFENRGSMTHQFDLDAFDQHVKPIPPGGSGEITFVADKSGTFEYACRLNEHELKGELGFLIVK